MHTTIHSTLEIIRQNKAVPVFYHQDMDVCEQVVKLCYKEGFCIFEFTNRGSNAAEIFTQLRKIINAEMPDMLLGAGTIFSQSDAEKFASLGADFIVSPIFNENVGQFCKAENLLWIPGCVTPTEIYQAYIAGAQLIKLFPGDLLGASYVKNIRPVFPYLNFMPTGGVTTDEDNLKTWFDAGVMAVGLGSQLFPKNLIEAKDWIALKKHINQAIAILHKI